MQELITIIEHEPRVSHRVVAENTNNQQKNINELIKKYHDDFSEFGTPLFKTEGIVNNGKGEQPKTYYLNEPQATFLMTLLRNKPIVVEFKKKLVKEFYKQREELQTPSIQNDLAPVLIELIKGQQKQTDMIIELLKQKQEVPQVAHSVYIDSRSRKKLRDAITSKAREQSDETGVSSNTIAPSIWIELKRYFDVDDYQDLLQSQMGAVMHFVMFWEAKKQTFKSAAKEFPFGGNTIKVI